MRGKYFVLSFAAVLFLVCFSSCTKHQTQPKQELDCSVFSTADNTWDKEIKTIISVSCATPGCHNAISNAGQINLSTYTATVDAFKNRDMFCALKHEGTCIYMPLGQPKLSDEVIARIECWANENFPE